MSRRLLTSGLAGILLVAQGACSVTASDRPHASSTTGQVSQAPPVEYVAQGLVVEDKGFRFPQLCLGDVYAGLPPRCKGLDLVGWDWGLVDGFSSDRRVKQGHFLVAGTWRNGLFTVTRQPISTDDGLGIEATLGRKTPYPEPDQRYGIVRLKEIESQEARRIRPMSHYSDNVHVYMTVVHDDGTLKKAMNKRYGADVVIVESAVVRLDSVPVTDSFDPTGWLRWPLP